MEPETVLEKIRDKLSQKIEVEKIYLYGSRARGNHHRNSDFDIAVISEDFKDLNHQERYQSIIDPIREIISDKPVDVNCYTPKEFQKGKKGFLPKIIEEEGISA